MATQSASKKYDLTGKVALVTGSSSGIGASIATQLASYGAYVTITGRNVEAITKVAHSIESSGSPKPPLQIVGDLLDPNFAPKLVRQTVAHFGRLDILVNNAGWGHPSMSFSSGDLMEAYEKVMNLNLRSAIQMTHLCLPELEKTSGCVINISSVAAVRPYRLLYSTSKAALDMVTKCGAAELGPRGIRVNSINPGPVWTAFGRSLDDAAFFPKMENIVEQLTPLGRIAQPQEIAHLASFLASDDAANITGACILTDGGMAVQGLTLE